MFGANLKRIRKENGITQVKLAEVLGLDKSSIAKYESAGVLPSVETLKQISDYFGVSIDTLVSGSLETDFRDIDNFADIEIIGTVKAGVDGIAKYEYLGTEKEANLKNPANYKFLTVRGDSMAPQILENDLALVRLQPNIENGELGVVIIDGEEGVIKKIQKDKNSISLISFNPTYETRVFVGDEMKKISIFGKVIKIERRY